MPFDIRQRPPSPQFTAAGRPLFLMAIGLGIIILLAVVAAPPSLKVMLPAGLIALAAGVRIFSKPGRALLIYVFLLPLEVYLSSDLRVTTNQIFQILLLSGWLLFFVIPRLGKPVHSVRSRPIRLLVGGLAFYLVLSLLWSVNLDASLRSLYRHLAAIGIFWVIISVVRKRSELNALITSICLGAAVVVVYGLLQYWRRGYDALYPLFSPFYQELWKARGSGFSVVATFANPNLLAAFGLMVLPLVFSKATNRHSAKRGAWSVLAAGLMSVILLTFSKSSWVIVAFLAVLWLALSLRWPLKFVVAAVLTVAVSLAVLNMDFIVHRVQFLFANIGEASVAPRLDVWRAAFSAFGRRPLSGYGLDGFEAATAPFRSGVSTELARAHNTYLQTLVDSGLLGFVIYFGTLAAIFFAGLRSFLRASSLSVRTTLLGLLLSVGSSFSYSFFDDLNSSNSYVSLLWVVMGLLVAAVTIQDRESGSCVRPDDQEGVS